MQLFNSILQDPDTGAPRTERRRTERFTINPAFPLKTVLSYVGRDDTGVPMSDSRHGWNWKGRLIDCSEEGARLQLGPGLKAIVGEACDLKLSVQDFELTVPCHVANIAEQDDGMIFGLIHTFADEAAQAAYRQLVEVLALGATLKARTEIPQLDRQNGYLVEQYANDRPARLTIWREQASRGVVAFEFLLKDNVVQAAAGQVMEYLTGDGHGSAHSATAAKAMEIQRLFQWVVPNLPSAVPDDVREFLKNYA